MLVFLLLVLIIIVCMLAIYFHLQKLSWKIDRLEEQQQALQKQLQEKSIN